MVTYKYADFDLATGNNDGGADGTDTSDPTDSANWTDAWQSLQAALDGLSGATHTVIFCRGTDSLSAQVDVDRNAGANSDNDLNNPYVFVGCPAGNQAPDGTRAVIDGQNGNIGSLLLFDSTYDLSAIHFHNFEFKRSGDYSGVGMDTGFTGHTRWFNCTFHDNNDMGFNRYYGAGGHWFWRCSAYNNGNDGFGRNYSYMDKFFFCRSYDNDGDGFAGSAYSGNGTHLFFGCVAHDNGGWGFDELEIATLINCIAHANGSGGFNDIYELATLVGCRVTGHSGAGDIGVEPSGSRFVTVLHSFFYNNTTDIGGNSWTKSLDSFEDSNLYTGTEGYQDAANDLFNLTNSATYRSQEITLP